MHVSLVLIFKKISLKGYSHFGVLATRPARSQRVISTCKFLKSFFLSFRKLLAYNSVRLCLNFTLYWLSALLERIHDKSNREYRKKMSGNILIFFENPANTFDNMSVFIKNFTLYKRNFLEMQFSESVRKSFQIWNFHTTF